ncbi:NmrA family NAD(P)-binding protein [Streptomyces sp. NPDC047046]|uniref:NmrA family NAD(P)-binding protein n=1 Tax=Streptomyces sp. NPDC047046 TaxID=3155378 RepID=UPI0033DD1C37
MILVTTAGKVGAHAARLLAAERHAVRVLCRSAEKAASLRAAGAQAVVGDLAAPDSIDAAMRGVSGVILVSPAVASQELAVVDSAARAGVEHIVKVSSQNAPDSPIARRRGQARIEAGLLRSGIPATLLHSNAYMQNFLMTAPQIAGTNTFDSATGEGRVGHVDARDVAAAAARIAGAPTAHRGRAYRPSGPAALSAREVAAVFSDVLSRPVVFRPVTADAQRRAMVDAGLPEQVAEDNAKALGMMAEGDCDWVTGDVLTILGRPPRSFADFVADHADAFTR